MAQNKEAAEYVTFMLLDSESKVESPWSAVPLDERGQPIGNGVPMELRDKYPIAISQQVQHYVGTGTKKELVTDVIRYISECDTPYLSEQIKKGYPANRKHRLEDITELQFVGGLLTTSKLSLIAFLKANAGYDKFEGKRLKGQRPKYKEYIVADKRKEELDDFVLATSVANAIATMKDVEKARRVVILYHPTYDNVEKIDLNEAKLILRNIMTNDPKGIAWLKHQLIDKSDDSELESASITVSAALQLGYLSFESLPGYAAIDSLKTDNWQPLIPVADILSPSEKIQSLSVWLGTTPEGASSYDVLKTIVEKEKNTNGK